MKYENALKNRRIIIRRTRDGEIIADTKILRFNSSTNSVAISADSLSVREDCNVSVLIFGVNNLYEFGGNIRGVVIENEIDVLLGKRKEKENRKKTRYPVMIGGCIKNIKIKDINVKLRTPIEVVTVNMSSNGVLIRADSGCFEIGSKFIIVMEIEKKEMELSCEVVRIQDCKPRTEEYGCRIKEVKLM